MKRLAAALVCAFSSLVTAHAAPRPNIVVFLSDDMNWHHPGFNGGAVETPHLDRLAREGARLTQFYVHSVCSPTRAAFLTGRYPFRNGMEERSHGNDVAGMLTDERTLAQALGDAGYTTALIGKWHLGNWYQRHLPLARGFDYHYGLYGALVSYYGKMRATYYDWHRNGETIRQDGYTTDLIADECVDWLKARRADRPFFLYVPFNAVHGPDAAPQALIDKYLALAGRQAKPKDAAMAVQYAMVDSMDSAIGRVLGALEAERILDDTLVIFFNDNGGRIDNPPFRGGKGDTYEGGVRVSCLVRWPGHIEAGASRDGIAHAVDLYPTLVKLAGGSLEQPLPLDGLDLSDMLVDGAPSPRTEVVLSLPGGVNSDTGIPAIRQRDWKLVGDELFDLGRDASETRDLAAQYPDVVRTLKDRLADLARQRRTPEAHTNISRVIDRPLLVFGEHENAHPPEWLAEYVRTHGETKQRQRNR